MIAGKASPVSICEGPGFVYALRTVTEAGARAAYEWLGSSERGRSAKAATQAMVEELNKFPIACRVVVGDRPEGANGTVRDLDTGAQVGAGDGTRRFDIAVDPAEGTSYLAKGMTNAMAVMALTPEGTMADPGPSFYMDKFVAPPAAEGKVDPDAPVEERLNTLSRVLGKPLPELTIYVLEKPRHRELVQQIRQAGAKVALYPAGDVAGALMAAIPDSGIDALMGTGGTREGLIAACAIRAMGGVYFSRLDPQLATEKAEIEKAGLDTTVWQSVDDLVRTEEIYFVATGIATGLLFKGVKRTKTDERTETLLIAGNTGERQILTTLHRRTNPA